MNSMVEQEKKAGPSGIVTVQVNNSNNTGEKGKKDDEKKDCITKGLLIAKYVYFTGGLLAAVVILAVMSTHIGIAVVPLSFLHSNRFNKKSKKSE